MERGSEKEGQARMYYTQGRSAAVRGVHRRRLPATSAVNTRPATVATPPAIAMPMYPSVCTCARQGSVISPSLERQTRGGEERRQTFCNGFLDQSVERLRLKVVRLLLEQQACRVFRLVRDNGRSKEGKGRTVEAFRFGIVAQFVMTDRQKVQAFPPPLGFVRVNLCTRFQSISSWNRGKEREEMTTKRTHEESDAFRHLDFGFTLDRTPRVVELCLRRAVPFLRLGQVLRSQDGEFGRREGRRGVDSACSERREACVSLTSKERIMIGSTDQAGRRKA